MKYLSKEELIALYEKTPRGSNWQDWLYKFHRITIETLKIKIASMLDEREGEIQRLNRALEKANAAETVWNAARYEELIKRSIITKDPLGWSIRTNVSDAQTFQQALDRAIAESKF